MQPGVRFYPATLALVVDGDTVDVVVDLGFNRITTTERLRLDGVDCPDLPDREAKEAAKQFTRAWFAARPTFLIRTRKTRAGTDAREKYGRIVAAVFSADGLACLNDDLVAAGHAEKVTY